MFYTLVCFVEEIVIAFFGGDWGCGATAELLFGGDEVRACRFINALAP